MPKSIAGEVVVQYLTKFPNLPSRAIARLAVEENPQVFKDVESTRRMVRSYRGADGAKHKARNYGGGAFHKTPGKQSDGHIPLPPPLDDGKPWSVVPIQFKRALVLSDVHVPHHDEAACVLAIKHGKKAGVDCIIINGDLCDFHSVSFWERDPRRRSLVDELQVARRFLEVLRDTFPKARIVFKEGNHEERLTRWVWSRVPEFAGLDGVSLAEVLYLADYGIELVDMRRPIKAGNHLHILHGHEFRAPFQNPVNPARGLYLRAKCNAMCGDLHQTSEHTETGLEKVVSCWSVGCLCDLHPGYMPLNKWNLGFAVIECAGNAWRVENRKIINGSVV